MRVRLAIILGKLVSWISRWFGLGAGATWPGEIALWLDKKILQKLVPKGAKVILVAGTNGKTTTVRLIKTVLSDLSNLSNLTNLVISNDTGANLLNGAVSALILAVNWSGRVDADFIVLETDEASLPLYLKQITPDYIVLLNLFRDQLDRYGEVDSIAKKWEEALGGLSNPPAGPLRREASEAGLTKLVINADDPHLAWLGKKYRGPVVYFGLDDKEYFLSKTQHAADSIYCPDCNSRLNFTGVYFSHLGEWQCRECGLEHPKNDRILRDFGGFRDFKGLKNIRLEGVYNFYNLLAAAAVLESLGVAQSFIVQKFKEFKPAFGRQEEIGYNGKRIKILLSKNPAGFNASLRTVLESEMKGPLLCVLNDRIPDGRDVSWIWDVDFELLTGYQQPIFVSGERVWDLAVRLKYANLGDFGGVGDFGLRQVIEKALGKTKVGKTLWILATYSAMLEVRKILLGRKIS